MYPYHINYKERNNPIDIVDVAWIYPMLILAIKWILLYWRRRL